MLFDTGDMNNSAIFTRKYLCWSIFLIKLFWCLFIKKRFQHRYFPVNIVTFLKRVFVIKAQWLLLIWPSYILWMINELIALSSCAMSQARVSIIINLQLQINRYKLKIINKNVSKWFSFIFILESIYFHMLLYKYNYILSLHINVIKFIWTTRTNSGLNEVS